MNESTDDITKMIMSYLGMDLTHEQRRWVDLYLKIDSAFKSIVALPQIENDETAKAILVGFSSCLTVEAFAKQVDLLADHMMSRYGQASIGSDNASTQNSARTSARLPGGGRAGLVESDDGRPSRKIMKL